MALKKKQTEFYYDFPKELRWRAFSNSVKSFGAAFGMLEIMSTPVIYPLFVPSPDPTKRRTAMMRLTKIQRWWKAKMKLRVPVLTPEEQVYFNRNLWRLILSYTQCPLCKRYRTITAPHAIWNKRVQVDKIKLIDVVAARKAEQLAKWYCRGGDEWMFEYDIEYDERFLVGPLEKWRNHRPTVPRHRKLQVCCETCDPEKLLKEGKAILAEKLALQEAAERERAARERAYYGRSKKKRRAPRSRRSYSYGGFMSSDES